LAALRHVVHQPLGRDLPGEAPRVLAPAAGALLAAILGDRIPIAVGLFLIVGEDHEADRLVGFEVRTTIKSYEWAPEHGEFDRQFVSLLSGRIVAGRAVNGFHFA